MFASQDRPDVARRRRQWKAYQARIDPARLVFIDETWTKTNMAPLRGWCRRGARLIGKAPHGRWRTLTFLAALRCDRIDAPCLSGALWQNVPPDELDLPPEQITLLSSSAYFHMSSGNNVTVGIDLPTPGAHYNGAFGTPFDARRFNRDNAFTLLMGFANEKANAPRLFLTVGDDDSHQLWRGAIAFYESARAIGLDAELRMTDGDHTWALWREAIVDALAFLNDGFRPGLADR